MFRSARLKLTIWYLLIIMLVSGFFSTLVYFTVTKELNRGFRMMELRHRAQELGLPTPRFFPQRLENLDPKLKELLENTLVSSDLKSAKKRVAVHLISLNGVILLISAIASYYLAGKTLKPIETAHKQQKRFIADASHELRTPLTSLKTSIEVALRDKYFTVKKARSVLKSNLEEIDSMKNLTDNLLSISRLKSNGNNFHLEKTYLLEVVKKAKRKILPLAEEKKVEISVEIKDCVMSADKESLEKMLVIFLDNAIKYTKSGGKVTLSSKIGKKHSFITIKDTGIGIDEKDLPYIFDRFYRADKSRAKKGISGFGLGLALAKKIIKMHQGNIKVESVVDKGTTFTIQLPLKHR